MATITFGSAVYSLKLWLQHGLLEFFRISQITFHTSENCSNRKRGIESFPGKTGRQTVRGVSLLSGIHESLDGD